MGETMQEIEVNHMSLQKPLVSIVITVYNHQNYIEECLRSIAMQKVDFPYEVFVGEDCSTDNTREVLKALEKELPSNFHILYRENNLGPVANGEDLYNHAKGTYFVDFEGDDFFLSPERLARQVEILENHPEYSAVYSNCIVVGEDSKPNGEKYPECPYPFYSYEEFFFSALPGQSGTHMCRREDYIEARKRFMSLKKYQFYPGDRRNAFLFLGMGKVYCIQEPLTAYRHVTKRGSSFSANLKKGKQFARDEVAYGETLLAYAERYGDKEAVDAAKDNMYRFKLRWSHGKRKVQPLGQVVREIMGEKEHRLRYLTSPVRWYAGLLWRVLQGRSIVL